MARYFEINGKKVKVDKSPLKDKDLRATFKDGKKIDFGAKDYPEYPGTRRGDNYCARSSGIKSKGVSANELSRKILWKCKGKKSKETYREAGVKIIKKEEYFDSI